MQKLLTILAFIIWTLPSAGQKVRYVGDKSTFLCKGDSLEHALLEKLKLQGVDTVITALYDFDNGRVEHSQHNIFWKQNGITWLRTFKGCDNISGDTTVRVNLNELFAYITATKFKSIEEPIQTEVIISHNMGYFISAFFSAGHLDVNVRDYQRRKIPGNEKAIIDSRVVLTNMIDSLIKESTSANRAFVK